jgi:alpha-ketoglutarate-dependent taurine dioxygenase
VFDTADAAEVERIAARKGWDITWLEDGSVQLWQEILPAMKTHPRTGETVWFNQTHIFAPEASLRWASRDGRREQWRRLSWAYAENPELVDHVFHGDGTQVSAADAEHLFDVFVDAEVRVRWKAGDLLLLDNILAVHGRTAFTGDRKVLAALIRDQAPQDTQPANQQETEWVEA